VLLLRLRNIAAKRQSPGQELRFRTAPNAPIDWDHDLIGELTPGSTLPHSINASGQVTGQSGPDGTAHAFRTGPNASINPLTDDLGVLSGTRSEGTDINDGGMVVGNFYVYDPDLDDDVPRAFRSTPNNVPGQSIALGGLGGNSSSALAVNNIGQIVGWAKRSDGQTRAFKLDPGEVITAASDLGTLGGSSAVAFDINNLGWIVGDAGTADGSAGAFVYDGSTMLNLNSLIDDGGSWTIYQGLRINDQGQILAFADRNGVFGYIRLDPVPEPAGIACVAGLVMTLGQRRRKRA
jgi:probable HAF family extracellular repeat protein